MVGESADPHEEGGRTVSRVKFPDDPDIRVELSENVRAELMRRDPGELAEHLAALSGGAHLHRSSITRYAQGRIAPKLGVARKLAKAFDWPLAEVVAGYSQRHGWPTLDWARRILYARTFRRRTASFLDMFRTMVVANTHFGYPSDSVRGWRRLVRPPTDYVGYACFEIVLEKSVQAGGSVDFVLSYCVFERPRIFSDFGKIAVTPGDVRSVEIWTHRTDQVRLAADATSFWVVTWVDGKAVDFIVRSSRGFAANATMVPEADLPLTRPAMVRFKAGPIHKHCTPEDGSAKCVG